MFSKLSVKKPYTVVVGVVMVLLLGFISFTSMVTDLLPKMELPYVIVMTTYPGASPEKIEKTVTEPLEQAVATASNVKNITSVSQENLSLIILEFADDVNMDSVMIDLNGKIDLVKGALDDMVSAPTLMALNPDQMPIMMSAVDFDNMTSQQISDYVQDKVVPELKKVGGVASVTPNGLLEQTVQIRLDQDKINAINDIMLASVNQELAKTQRELRDAKQEIVDQQVKLTDGKNLLSEKKGETFDQLAQGSAKLDQATAQLSSLMSEETQLTTQQKALETEKSMMESGLTQMESGLAQIQAGLDQVDAVIPALQGGIAGIAGIPDETEIETLPEPQKTMIQAFVAKLTQLKPEFSLTTIKDVNDVAEQILEELSIQKTELEVKQAELLSQKNTLQDTYDRRKPQIETDLNNLVTKLQAATMMKTQLQATMDELTKNYVKLENGKMVATGELTKAEIELLQGETALNQGLKQVEDAQKQLDDARDEALKSANLSQAITPSMINTILSAQNFSMPAGSIQQDKSTVLVKVGDPFSSLEELENLVLMSTEIEGLETIRLSDLAEIVVTDNSGEIYAKINGNDGIILTIQKQSIASTSDVCDKLTQQMDLLSKQNEGLHFTALMNQGDYIRIVIDSVIENLIYGGLLAALVLLLFLKDLKPTLVISFSIPISLLAAITMMYFSGVTINIISLSGLALGVGMLVDNSVVVIENIYRLRNEGVPVKEAAIQGAKQVTGAIFASTLTTICVFLPIVFTTGLARQLFTDMGLTIAYSLLASLLVALTLVPMMGSTLLKKTVEKKHPWYDRLVHFYEKALAASLRHKLPVLLLTCGLLVLAIFVTTTMGTELIPAMSSAQMSVTLEMPKETTREELLSTTDVLVDEITKIESIDSVGAMQSSSLMSTSVSTNTMDFMILLKEGHEKDGKNVKSQLEALTLPQGAVLNISTSQMDMSALGGSGIQIMIKGNDLDQIQSSAREIGTLLRGIEGIDEVSDGDETPEQELRVVIDKSTAMEYNLTVAQVYSQLAEAIKEETSSIKLDLEDRTLPVVIVQDDVVNAINLSNLKLKGTQNQEETEVSLSEIADVTDAVGLSSISHTNQQRTFTVTATIKEGYNIGLVSRNVQTAMKQVEIPQGFSYEIAGENESIQTTLIELVKMIALAIVFIYMIMVAQFQSLLSPFIVMFTIPLAFTGGLLALWISGFDLSIIAMLGFLVLSGVVVNNGIVFIDFANQQIDEGMEMKQALLYTGKTRLRPILMTAITTILGLTTMALALGSGSEMLQPLAIVTIGGLTYATLLTLFVVPVLYAMFNRKRLNKKSREQE